MTLLIENHVNHFSHLEGIVTVFTLRPFEKKGFEKIYILNHPRIVPDEKERDDMNKISNMWSHRILTHIISKNL